MARRRAPSAAEAVAIAAQEAAPRMAGARKASTAAKQAALAKVLAEITTTVPLCDEERQRIAQDGRNDAHPTDGQICFR